MIIAKTVSDGCIQSKTVEAHQKRRPKLTRCILEYDDIIWADTLVNKVGGMDEKDRSGQQ